MDEENPAILDIPYDVLLRIFQFMPSRDLVHFLSCCRTLHALVNEESIWRTLSATYGLHDIAHFSGRSWYAIYTRLLHPYGPMIGLWAGDHAYTGDILDIRLHPGDAQQPGGIILEAWRFRPMHLEDVDGPEMPELPIYTPLIRIDFSTVETLHGDARIACCVNPGATPHDAFIGLFSSTSQSLFLHTRQGQHPHPEFPVAEIRDCIDSPRYPHLPLRESITVDRSSYLSPQRLRGQMVFSAPTNHIKPPAISLSCSQECVDRARVFHGFHEDIPYLPRYYPLQHRVLAGVDPPSPDWHPSSLVGLWLGSHGQHGTECLYLDWDRTLSVLHAWKITGDTNVPRGALSWRANTADLCPSSRLPDWIDDHDIGDLTKCRFFEGTGVVSARGFLPHQRNDVDIILVVAGSDILRLLWTYMSEVSAYVRYK